ncbi:MAG TPA: response regulator transcription factor [Solirubrobacteraceae bacterium]|nr:response regulator transcription factor [Solirubrobacteraceae bacterium]
MPDPDDALRVVIADDHRIFRDGLRGTLQEAGMRVVGEAADGAEAVALARELEPDVVVLDLNMPGVSGLDALRQIARGGPDVQTVVLTVSVEDRDVLAALVAGACGYLVKDMRVDRLAAGIAQAAEGHMVLSSGVARALTAYVRASAEAGSPGLGEESGGAGEPVEGGGKGTAGVDGRAQAQEPSPALTPREVEVLRLIVEGADNIAIGLELSISPHTVKQYVTNIFEKLGVRSRVQAAVYALRAGLV